MTSDPINVRLPHETVSQLKKAGVEIAAFIRRAVEREFVLYREGIEVALKNNEIERIRLKEALQGALSLNSRENVENAATSVWPKWEVRCKDVPTRDWSRDLVWVENRARTLRVKPETLLMVLWERAGLTPPTKAGSPFGSTKKGLQP